MHSLLTQAALSAASGSVVGFSLGLVGGGGSILAVPLLVYVVGLNDSHVAIGTSAVAVNAGANLGTHARSGNVKWRCATTFAVAGVAGAYLGSTLGKIMDGQRLLALFAVLMMVVGGLMLRNRAHVGNSAVSLSKENLPKLIVSGLGVGVLSGFFGIGRGFLIVPALMLATGMPMLNAIGSSLVSVTAFGLTTAANYALSGLIDWQIAVLFVGGGIFGGLIGARLAKSLGSSRGALTSVFAGLIFAIAIYVLFRYLS
ncbi:hypothetical protein SAMN05216338_10238 [Bradyrhizobium sp. Rc2d]|uniref:sulfite exporter TauE/SafE family protein n=1 Tax=Bradyrhizobium sp. Rc2d TaxID=1855321 RepID=UPI0008819248|nr:sulfite exporter TauE/SafE family protein [Bradyrhizobium sp. Rc2d]SDI45293.1 hypothetical protein SAMN05216338_10238 [Bradyrhizobium sp. Rc2d]